MPIYEYEHQGRACHLGRVFEYEQSIKDSPLGSCPECGKPVRRVISVTRINVRHARGREPKRKKPKGRGINLIDNRGK